MLTQIQDLNLEIVDASKLSVLQQAHLLAAAPWIVAPHGGAMANLVFASSGAQVLELHSPNYQPPYFLSLAYHQQLLWHTQRHPEQPPQLYQDLLFEGPGTEPIGHDVQAVVEGVRRIATLAKETAY